MNCEKNDGKFGGNEWIIVLGTIHIHTIRKLFKISGKNFSSMYKFKSIEVLRIKYISKNQHIAGEMSDWKNTMPGF